LIKKRWMEFGKEMKLEVNEFASEKITDRELNGDNFLQ